MYQSILRSLENSKVKLTHQRKAVAKAMCNSSHHITVETIWRTIKDDDHEIGIATIYRTLHLFEKLDIVIRIPIPNGSDMYELNESHQHLHMICKYCGYVMDLPVEVTDMINKEINHKGELTGYLMNICKECYTGRVHD